MTPDDPAEPVLLRAGPTGCLLAGHVAAGPGPAQVAVLRTGGLPLFGGTAGSPAAWWTSTALADAGPPRHDVAGCATAAGVHHGVNRAGLLVACTVAGPAARSGLAAALLATAGAVEEAAALVAAAAASLDGPDRVWLADAGEAVRLDAGPGGVDRHPLPPSPGEDADLGTLRTELRSRAPHGVVSAIAALLDPAGPALLVCLGPPRAGIFLRQWPGLPPPPPLTAADRPPLLGSLAVARGTAAPDPATAAALASAEAEALAEGDEAERLARIMDSAGDDHGAEVRRALAQAHAADIAVAALEGVAAAGGPAGPPYNRQTGRHRMLVNPPPAQCDSCKRVVRAGFGSGLDAGDPAAWIPLLGPDESVTLDDGRAVIRRGRGWTCRRCGHTVPLSREHLK